MLSCPHSKAMGKPLSISNKNPLMIIFGIILFLVGGFGVATALYNINHRLYEKYGISIDLVFPIVLISSHLMAIGGVLIGTAP